MRFRPSTNPVPLLALVLLATSWVVLAQSAGGEFEITRQTLDSGGGRASGAEFSVNGTVGQPEAAPQTAASNEYRLSGGFWPRAADAPPTADALFSDGFESP